MPTLQLDPHCLDTFQFLYRIGGVTGHDVTMSSKMLTNRKSEPTKPSKRAQQRFPSFIAPARSAMRLSKVWYLATAARGSDSEQHKIETVS